MSFTNDEKWNQAKQLAKREGQGTDWCYIVTLYNGLGGKQIAVFITFPKESSKYRVIGVTDQDTTIIEDNKGKLTEIASSESLRLKKIFETNDYTIEVSKNLGDKTVLGESILKYYIESEV